MPLAPRRLWWVGAGFALWCSALVVLYALHAIGCRFGWQTGALRLVLASLLLVHMGAIAWLWWRFSRAMHADTPAPTHTPVASFVQALIVWTLIAALVSALLAFAPALLLTTCT